MADVGCSQVVTSTNFVQILNIKPNTIDVQIKNKKKIILTQSIRYYGPNYGKKKKKTNQPT